MQQIPYSPSTPIVGESTDNIPLKIENLSVKRSGKIVIKDIGFTINRGDFVGIVGPNGSGKSTLLLTILGLLKPATGKVAIYGASPQSRELFGRIGWVSQAASNLPKHVRITVRELVELGTLNAKNMFSFENQKRRASVKKAIEMVGLQEAIDVDVSRLSGGQRQRAVIARALASESEFILLDEPLVGIDREARKSLLKLLDQLCHDENKTILMVSHDLTAMRQTAHRMIFLEETIRFDGPTENFPDLDKLADLRGIEPVHEQSCCIEDDSEEEE
ncbi:MAG: metal ABC transporter ATP-binding protein [Candidatus Thermoplasmatota archaeon]|nr:metal ABC transporter ATP-binding protein [Candidatus Thermoplasmatota archaeon]